MDRWRPNRILCVKLADMGDALLTTPALRLLRTAHPRASIDVLAGPAAAKVYHHVPFVDDVIVLDKRPLDRLAGAWRGPFLSWRVLGRLRRRRYDAVVVFHALTTRWGALKHAALATGLGAPVRAGLGRRGSAAWRGWFLTHAAPDPGYDGAHVVEAMRSVAALLAPADLAARVDRSLTFEPGRQAHVNAAELLNEVPGAGTPQPLVAIHPGTGAFSSARRWGVDGFAAVADALQSDGCRVILVGTSEDPTREVHERCHQPVADLGDRTDLPTLAALLSRCRLVVCNDSGVMHLATAMDVPVVAVFGPSNDGAWGPWSAGPAGPDNPMVADRVVGGHRVVALDLPCRPCLYRGYRIGAPQGCRTRDCLSWLQPDAVVAAARRSVGADQAEAAK